MIKSLLKSPTPTGSSFDINAIYSSNSLMVKLNTTKFSHTLASEYAHIFKILGIVNKYNYIKLVLEENNFLTHCTSLSPEIILSVIIASS